MRSFCVIQSIARQERVISHIKLLKTIRPPRPPRPPPPRVLAARKKSIRRFAMPKQSFYAVRKGRATGVYLTW